MMHSRLAQRRRRLGTSASWLDAYAANGANPDLALTPENQTVSWNDLTFSRASTATYFDSSGTMQTASSGDPRSDAHVYSGGEWVKKFCQFESEARTNLMLYSKIIDPANNKWREVGDTDNTQGAETALDDTATATKLWTTSTAPSEVTFRYSIGWSTNTPYVASMHAKAGEMNFLRIRELANSANGQAWFNLSTGAVGSAANLSAGNYGMIPLGGGWYRCWIAFTTPASIANNLLDFGAVASAGVGGSTGQTIGNGIYVWGAQLEPSQTLSSFIPVPGGSTVTRAAEALSIPSAEMPLDGGGAMPEAISINLKGLVTYADKGVAAQHTFARWQADANNFVSLDLDTDSTATGEVNANQAATTVVAVPAAAEYSPGVDGEFNIASRHSASAINVAKDGVAATEDTTPTALADLSAEDFEIGPDFMGFVEHVLVWKSDIADAGIAEATA